MNKIEIEQYINVSRTKSVIVDRRELIEYPGYIRDSIIISNNTIRLEFNKYNHEYGGLTFYFKYRNLDILILSLEEYFNIKIEHWININKTGFYPEISSNIDFKNSTELLKNDFINNNIVLPENYIEKNISEGYWKDLYYANSLNE